MRLIVIKDDEHSITFTTRKSKRRQETFKKSMKLKGKNLKTKTFSSQTCLGAIKSLVRCRLRWEVQWRFCWGFNRGDKGVRSAIFWKSFHCHAMRPFSRSHGRWSFYKSAKPIFRISILLVGVALWLDLDYEAFDFVGRESSNFGTIRTLCKMPVSFVGTRKGTIFCVSSRTGSVKLKK